MHYIGGVGAVDAVIVVAVPRRRRRRRRRGDGQGDLADVLDAGLGVGRRHLLEAAAERGRLPIEVPAVAPLQLPCPAHRPPPALLLHPQLLHHLLQVLDPLVQRRRHADVALPVDLLPPLSLRPPTRASSDRCECNVQMQ
jgi:hypothetical protein